MKQKILSVYVNLEDEEFNIPDYLNDKKFFIHISPESIRSERFSKKAVKKVISALERGCILGQRGNLGRCLYESFHKDTGTDSWHENYCPYNPSHNLNTQYHFMLKGLEILKDVFKTSPKSYSPPNHLFDFNTLKAVKTLGYDYMMDKNYHGISVYEKDGLVIIPEEKLISTNRTLPKSNGVYVHLRDFDDFLLDKIKEFELILPEIITLIPTAKKALALNHAKKMIGKYKRDTAGLRE